MGVPPLKTYGFAIFLRVFGSYFLWGFIWNEFLLKIIYKEQMFNIFAAKKTEDVSTAKTKKND